jgi:hypothetical protein
MSAGSSRGDDDDPDKQIEQEPQQQQKQQQADCTLGLRKQWRRLTMLPSRLPLRARLSRTQLLHWLRALRTLPTPKMLELMIKRKLC